MDCATGFDGDSSRVTIARPRGTFSDVDGSAAVFLGFDLSDEFDAIGCGDEVGDDASACLDDELATSLEGSVGLCVLDDDIVDHELAVATGTRPGHGAHGNLEAVSAVVAYDGAWPASLFLGHDDVRAKPGFGAPARCAVLLAAAG